MRVSVVVPTYKGAKFIPYLLRSLGKQENDNFEVIFVVKPSGDGTEGSVREICGNLHVKYRILIQKKGFVSHAYNMGISNARGEFILFADDDAVVPKNWISSYINAYEKFRNVGAVSGHDIQSYVAHAPILFQASFGLKSRIMHRLNREWQFMKPIFNRPHPLFRKYLLGIYITRRYKVAAGFDIPFKRCTSLPVKGVNMSIRKEAIEDAHFPEHPSLKIAPNLEQYFVAQLVLRGWESIYDPGIRVYHLTRVGLSKSPRNSAERKLMGRMIAELFVEQKCDNVAHRNNPEGRVKETEI